MSLQYPLKHIYITQPWGVNPATYARFGYKGHNGTDYRLFDEQGHRSPTAILYAPHDGKVIEARNDANGYGLYLKIENDKEGSILAHLKSFSVNVGDTVTQGQKIGVCDNTGWSTGAHLHWGYFTKPRNRQNGYGGTINQEELEIRKIGDSMADMYGSPNQYDLTNRESMKVAVDHLNAILKGEYVKTEELDKAVDQAYDEGLKVGREQGGVPDDTPPEIDGWKNNGLQVQVGPYTYNYEKDE